MALNNVFVVRESFGTYAVSGPPSCQPWDGLKKDEDEARFLVASSSGNRFAVGNSSTVTIFDARNGNQVCLIRNRMTEAELSPNGTYLMGWDNPTQNADNFKIWAVGSKNPTVVYALKLSQSPFYKSKVQFSGDETLYSRLMANNAVHFSQVPDFPTASKKSPENLKIESFSLSTGTGAPHVLCYIPASTSGTPSFARLFRYPDFETTIASKSFFQADRVEMKWNQKGTAVLVITYTDIDKTGGSYYGKTMLHYLDTKGSNATVQTNNDAPVIHAAEWNPNTSCTEFCVITGKMPQTRASLFNSKCEVIFDMGISARNAIYFNRQGNLLLLGGFGNLSHGAVEIWEIKKLKKKVAQLEAPATTQLQWLNDGVHFVTATTAPRRRTDNGFKVWDFTGKLVHEWRAAKEFYGFLPFYSPEIPVFPDSKLDALGKQLGNKIIPPKEEANKAGAYVLPHLRKGGAGALQSKPQSQSAKPKADSVQLTETEKKIKAARKKLDQIQKLKEQQSEGKVLEKNQLEKIASEATLLKEIQALEIA